MQINTIVESSICTPHKGSDEAAGLDLRSSEWVGIQPGERQLVKTGVKMALPYGTVGLLWPRSKLANTYGIQVLGGVIDSDYRGEIMAILYNSGDEPVYIEPGDRVVQLIVQPVFKVEAYQVSTLDDTSRGNSGVNSEDLRIK